jgi:Carbohydrate-selective porin, OprB family/S-layer homology domain
VRLFWLHLAGHLSAVALIFHAPEAIAQLSSPLPHHDADAMVDPASSTREGVDLAVDAGLDEAAMGQMTSVAQLADVQPTDWAFEALRSLTERYGCLDGYPDGLFRGQRPVSRYEFAVALNACFDRINEAISATASTSARATDLTALERLLREFSTEIGTLRDRTDDLEARSAQLDANRFSTTTRLTGEAIVAFNDGFQDNAADPHFVFLSQLRFNLETSFTGQDLLLVQLQTGTGGENDDAADYLQRDEAAFRDSPPSLETNPDRLETAQTINQFLQYSSGLDYSGSGDRVFLEELSYTFSPLDDVSLSIFAQAYASDYVDFNRYANDSARDFSGSGFVNNQLLLANDPAGAGAAISWTPENGWFILRAVYRAEAAAIAARSANAGNQGGLLGDPYLGVIELGFDPSDDVTVNLQYSSGAQNDSQYDVIGASVGLDLGNAWGMFGRFGYAFNFPGGIEPTSWSGGVTLSNLLIPGTVLGVGIGQPLIFQDDVVGIFNRTQTNFEAFYKLPLSERFSITPAIQVITNPGNQDNALIFTGTLRTVFDF